MRVPVCLVVGRHGQPDTINGYFGDVDELMNICRKHCQAPARLFASNEAVVRAFQRLHRLGEIELVIQRVGFGPVQEFIHDIDGDIVLPWPDNFFDMSFRMIFDEELKP